MVWGKKNKQDENTHWVETAHRVGFREPGGKNLLHLMVRCGTVAVQTPRILREYMDAAAPAMIVNVRGAGGGRLMMVMTVITMM